MSFFHNASHNCYVYVVCTARHLANYACYSRHEGYPINPREGTSRREGDQPRPATAAAPSTLTPTCATAPTIPPVSQSVNRTPQRSNWASPSFNPFCTPSPPATTRALPTSAPATVSAPVAQSPSPMSAPSHTRAPTSRLRPTTAATSGPTRAPPSALRPAAPRPIAPRPTAPNTQLGRGQTQAPRQALGYGQLPQNTTAPQTTAGPTRDVPEASRHNISRDNPLMALSTRRPHPEGFVSPVPRRNPNAPSGYPTAPTGRGSGVLAPQPGPLPSPGMRNVSSTPGGVSSSQPGVQPSLMMGWGGRPLAPPPGLRNVSNAPGGSSSSQPRTNPAATMGPRGGMLAPPPGLQNVSNVPGGASSSQPRGNPAASMAQRGLLAPPPGFQPQPPGFQNNPSMPHALGSNPAGGLRAPTSRPPPTLAE